MQADPEEMPTIPRVQARGALTDGPYRAGTVRARSGEGMDRSDQRRAAQRARAAETEVFAHYGTDAVSEPLVLADPPMTTRVVRVGKGPPTVLFHGATLTSTLWAALLPHLPDRSLYLVDLPGCGARGPVRLPRRGSCRPPDGVRRLGP